MVATAKATEPEAHAAEVSAIVREQEIAVLLRSLAERETNNAELEARAAEVSMTARGREQEIAALTG